jgi:hypothetical protein
MKKVKKFILFFSIIFLYFIFKEMVFLWTSLSSINIYLAYSVFVMIMFFIFYFAVLPIFRIIKLPSNLGPTKIESEVEKLRGKRIGQFSTNPFLLKSEIDINSLKNSDEDYQEVISLLENEAYAIRKSYVNRLFYSTSISQNGFIDAVMILSASINLVKEIFILYNGRVCTVELFIIAKKVYYSIVIGGTEGVEFVTNEIFSKLATESIKSIPFIDKIVTSLVDGFVNAALLTRVSLITENYCKILYIEKDRDLYPSSRFIATTAKNLTSEVLKQANSNILLIAKDKSGEILKRVFNPVAYVLDKSYSTIKDFSFTKNDNSIFDKIFFWKK